MKKQVKKAAPFRLTPAGLAGSFALLLLCLMGAVFSFTSAFLNPDIRRNFFRLLSGMGLSVELAVNEPTLSPAS